MGNKNSIVITRVIDGDTVCYQKNKKEITIRIEGIDCPEKKLGQGVDESHKRAGLFVKEYVIKLVEGKKVKYKKSEKKEKWGRELGKIKVNGFDLGEHLIEKKYAKIYDGGKKNKWTNDEINNILEQIPK